MATRRSRPPTGDNDHVDSKENNGNESGLPAPSTFNAEEAKKARHRYMKNPFKRDVEPAGESGRKGIHPWHFLRISFRSTSRASLLCNLLWPVVPAALAVRYSLKDHHTLIFILAYIAMVPCANLIGFAGQEMARKLPHVFGVLLEITLGSIVEIVLFMVLLDRREYYVVKAAILGSILATLLLCLGVCFFVGGLGKEEQHFSEVISETGSGLLLTAGVVLAVPAIYDTGLRSMGLSSEVISAAKLSSDVVHISRIIAVLLIISYGVYVLFQARTHHGIYDAIFEHDEEHDRDREKDLAKDKLTMTECVIALAISIALVTLIAISLVEQIKPIIEDGHVSDSFMGVILIPLVEKFAEHLTAVDEAYDNQMNLALSHVIGATLQTALFNAPLAVIVGWGLDRPMDLNFDIFFLAMLFLAIITVGRFLQDQKSNYLEGFLLVILYIAIAVAAFYNPLTPEAVGEGAEGSLGGESSSGPEGSHAARSLLY